jgi:hypothetical protein
MIIWNLKSVDPRDKKFCFYQKNASSMKKASKSVCKQPFLVYRHPFSYSINFFGYKVPENTEEDPDDPKPANEGISTWNTPLLISTAQL